MVALFNQNLTTMKKRHLFFTLYRALTVTFVHLLLGAGSLNAQSTGWLIGDQVIQFPRSAGEVITTRDLPQPNAAGVDPELQYQGAIATRSQYIQLDDRGSVLFFIIDGYLYDREGYLIAAGGTDAGACPECLLNGTSEVIVHPVPQRCGLWYIFQTRSHSIYLPNVLEFSVLDLRKENPLFPSDPERRGRLLNDGEIDSEGFDILLDWPSQFARYEMNASGEVPDDPDSKTGVLHMDAVTVEAVGRSFLLVTTGFYLIVYEMTTSNIIYRGTQDITWPLPPGLGLLRRHVKGELEAIASGSFIRVAISQWYKFSYPWPSTDIDVHLHFHAMELDASLPGVPVTYQDDVAIHDFPYGPLPFNVAGEEVNWPAISGLEFSPNGNYLYWVKSQPNNTDPWDIPGYLGYLDWTTFLTGSLPLLDLLPFVDSELELNVSPDGAGYALYVSGADEFDNKMLGALVGPDDPSTATWVPVAFPLSNTTMCDEWTLGWNDVTDRYYLLMAQAYDDPSDEMLASATCCEEVLTMTAEAGYTAPTGTQNWTPTSNPFGDLAICRFADDLVVPAGSHVTASDMVFEFAVGTALIIEPGGSFKCIDCEITSGCHKHWKGIEVRGNSTQGQEGVPHSTHQGMLELHTSIVENAEIGVLLSQRSGSGFLLSGNGGVVLCYNSTFHNCREGVHFNRYPLVSLQPPNRSRFVRTTFTVDENYPVLYDFRHHAYLWGVDGILFSQCTFENLVSDAFADGESAKLGHGIYSLDADYRIKAGCYPPPLLGEPCPEEDVMPSVFRGLDHAIHAEDAVTSRAFEADHCLFENNICGIYTSAVVGAKVTKNEFVMGTRAVSLTGDVDEKFQGRHRGVYSFDGYAFAVDDNQLSMSPGASSAAEGIVIGCSRDHNDYVFRNSATDLQHAYVGEGICADLTPSYTPIIGLQFLCNENTTDQANFWSRKINGELDEDDHIIRTNQGNYNRPADNHFDQWPDISPIEWDFQVTTTHSLITYWHRNMGDFVPTNFSSLLSPQQITTAPPANNCEKKLVAGPLDPNDLLEVKSYLLDEKLVYGNTRYLYDQLIDGGSTDEVVLEIMSSWPQDAWELHDYLMAKSPYLSVEALQQMVLRDILPDAMVAEICMANPEATQQERFLDWLQEESGYPLPAYMIDQIIASWDQHTFRSTLLNDMGMHHAEMTQAANWMMEYFRADSTSENLDSLRMVWQLVRTPAARYAEALTLVQQGDYTSATTVVEDIPLEHDLRDPDMLERQRMLDVIAFFESVAISGRTEGELTSAEQDELDGIIDGSYDRPAWWAQNLLCFIYDRCRAPLTGGEPELRSAFLNNAEGNVPNPMLAVHPNPASSWVAIEHDLRSEPANAMLVIRDVSGREVARYPLAAIQGQTIWDSRQTQPGAYTIELLNAGQLLRAEKLIIKP